MKFFIGDRVRIKDWDIHKDFEIGTVVKYSRDENKVFVNWDSMILIRHEVDELCLFIRAHEYSQI